MIIAGVPLDKAQLVAVQYSPTMGYKDTLGSVMVLPQDEKAYVEFKIRGVDDIRNSAGDYANVKKIFDEMTEPVFVKELYQNQLYKGILTDFSMSISKDKPYLVEWEVVFIGSIPEKIKPWGKAK